MKWQQHTRMVQSKTLAIPTPKPRNPHVAASRFRKAGAHGPGRGGARAEALRELRDQVNDLQSRGP